MEKQNKIKNINLKLTIEMTYLSNERSILAYLRTFIVFISTGVAILNIEKFREYTFWGYLTIFIGIIILLFGIYRFFTVRKNIVKIVKDDISVIK